MVVYFRGVSATGRQGGNELTTRCRAFALVLAIALAFGTTSAGAVPASKREQARVIKQQIDRLDERVELAAERYNEASAAHTKLLKEKKAAAAKLRRLKARTNVVQRHLNLRARSMYRSGRVGLVDVLLGAQSFEEFAATWDVLKTLNQDDAEAIATLKRLRAETRKAHAEYAAKEKAASDKQTVMRRDYDSISRDLAERKSKLSGIESEIAALEAEESRARAASAARSVLSAAPYERHFPPPTRAPRSEVVNIARRYLGAPYRWGAAGPNAFDCSGLTMFVYRQVGVYLPHSSRAQIGYGQRVSRSNLAPGDLVFFGSPIHHVGIYVGGGQMISAPHTGAVVRIEPLLSDYVGASRP